MPLGETGLRPGRQVDGYPCPDDAKPTKGDDMSKHRKPSTARRIARKLRALLTVTAAAGAVLASAGTAGAATHHDHVAADVKLCAYFPEFGSSLHHARATDWAWHQYLPGTDRELWQAGTALNVAIVAQAPVRVLRADYRRVYLNCNPDAAPMR